MSKYCWSILLCLAVGCSSPSTSGTYAPDGSANTGGSPVIQPAADTGPSPRALMLDELAPKICPTYAELLCRHGLDCPASIPQDALDRCIEAEASACRNSLDVNHMFALANGSMLLSEDELASCFSGWEADNCKYTLDVTFATHCSFVIRGVKPEGASCAVANNCVAPLACLNGTCAPAKTTSQPCTDASECEAGGYCGSQTYNGLTSRACMPLIAAVGTICDWQTYCTNGHCGASGKCEAFSKLGGPCTKDGYECGPALNCILPTTGSRVCMAGNGPGASCSNEAWNQCQTGLVCDSAFGTYTSQCFAAPAKAGDACLSTCPSPYQCVVPVDGQPGTCALRPGPGAACGGAHGVQCLTSNCSTTSSNQTGTCMPATGGSTGPLFRAP
jgi:hypothetical protein